MNNAEDLPFIPVLTVMVDYGNAPFLWLADTPDERGVGGNLCDGICWDESSLMSVGLWKKFADWAVEFDKTRFYSMDFDANNWNWLTFHARGVQLAHWLKEEVGGTYRVVYSKPSEDPNHRIEERTEILAGGVLSQLAPILGSVPDSISFCHHIVSGGQTGTDRAALDFAIEHGFTHGGWAPRGRTAEDGIIPFKYQLRELVDGGYRQRTRRNVNDSDATLIINLGELDGGTLATKEFAQRLKKPCIVAQLDDGVTVKVVLRVIEWLNQHDVMTLNVAGPRESKRPGIYRLTRELLNEVEKFNSF